MKIKCNITTIEEFDKAVIKVTTQMLEDFAPSCKFIVAMTDTIFATKLRIELFGESEAEQ